MLDGLALLGIGWLIANREMSKKTDDTSGRGEEKPKPKPKPEPQKWTKTAEWSGEAAFSGEGGENVVWFYRTGIRYADGTTKWDSSQYIVIGDKAHHNFLRQNVSGGTINIPKEMTGGATDQDNVKVFATLEAAEARADELSNPPEEDDPLGPQKKPEDDEGDDSGGLPSLPTRPQFPPFGGQSDYGFGGGAF